MYLMTASPAGGLIKWNIYNKLIRKIKELQTTVGRMLTADRETEGGC
jgi:hypothetical protein